ncbi:Arylsulfatase [Anaerohalosphaera lusitana]|uniref:Arylsulfatase n=1 Tax=Anaerohalosphaera lusitana TaxID=1936003 RepID=A0A1U9NHE2_9BACT|nr:sulfatase [Anaerohalosphaera lusitana]AQT67343.1 Arylsulfatase [Anaerohalosphaera lusitana]
MLNRRSFLKKAGFAAVLASSGVRSQVLGADEKSKNRKPNVVFILIDDMGWRDVGFMGSKYYETPNIDRLASEGMVFTDAYANAPNCAPSRACLMSGQYSPRHGVYTVAPSARGKSIYRKIVPTPTKRVLDPAIPTLAEALKPAGYVSASMGKWHLGNDPQAGPVAQGFDLNVGGFQAGHPKSYFSPYRNPELEDGPRGEYLTDRLTDEALKFIETNKDRPFFLYLPHYAVHTPLQAKKQMIEKYKNKEPDGGQNNSTYAAMVESTDKGVGRIMDKLAELGIEDETIVVFFSDNGGHGGVTDNSPLRGSKGMLYEGGIREPLIVKWPGKVKAGSNCDVPVIGTDFYPTLLEACGAKKPAGHVLDGESIVKLLEGGKMLERKAVFWHFPAYLGGYKPSQGVWRTVPGGAVRVGDWKLIEFFDDGHVELYNLKEDIGETNDLARKMPEKAKELHGILKKWQAEVDAPIPTEKNPRFDKEKFDHKDNQLKARAKQR